MHKRGFENADRYDETVRAIYAAGSGARSWESAMQLVADDLELWALQVAGVDKRDGSVMYSFEAGRYPLESIIDYIREYHPHNPRVPLIAALQPGEWMHDHEHLDENYVAGSAFFQDFLIPHGSRWCSGTKIIDDESCVVMMGALRGVGQSPLDATETAYLSRLIEHFALGLQIYRDSRPRSVSATAGQQVLERMAQPMPLLDESRNIHYCNPAARVALDSDRGVSVSNGQLRCAVGRDDNRLLNLLKDMLSPRHVGRADRRSVLRLTSQPAVQPMLLLLDTLMPEPTMHLFGSQPLALVMLHDLAGRRAIDPFIVAAAFDLTPAEAQVSVLLAEGLSPDDIARHRHVSPHTVRTQLRMVHGKVGITRQADLVRLIQEMPDLGRDPQAPPQSRVIDARPTAPGGRLPGRESSDENG
ncbi:MAG: helix-turn-helix transcriptional regulator [Burkholderiaceae bacterium]